MNRTDGSSFTKQNGMKTADLLADLSLSAFLIILGADLRKSASVSLAMISSRLSVKMSVEIFSGKDSRFENDFLSLIEMFLEDTGGDIWRSLEGSNS